MSGKRLRIRARVKLSEHNFDWLGGQEDGFKKGLVQGEEKANRRYVDALNQLRGQIAQLEKDVATHHAAARANERAVEDHRMRMLELEQENVLLRSTPLRSDWLSVPPFVVNVDPSLGPDKWAMTTVTGRSRPGNMIVRPRSHGRTPQPHIDQIAALYGGGFINPEQSRHFIDQIINRPNLLSQMRTVPMRPPGDPSFHWNADWAREEPDAPIRMLENHADPDFSETVELRAAEVRAAFRMPLLTGSEMRAPEAEEGIRRASAEGVTDEAGGHSHTIDLDIRVDDSELRDAITRVEALGENISNVGISSEDFQNLVRRMARLETQIAEGYYPTEESAGEENIDASGRADTEGGE